MFTIAAGENLKLGLLEERHAERVFALTDANRARLRQWLPWLDYTQTSEDSRIFIRKSLHQFANNDGFQAGIWYKGELAGMISYQFLDWSDRKTEIGYWLGAEFEGKGLMTQACRTMVDYAFTELGLTRIIILAATENVRSRAVPERLGFTQEGVLRQAEWLYDHFVDLAQYSMLADEWK